jgi:hypothetical protein
LSPRSFLALTIPGGAFDRYDPGVDLRVRVNAELTLDAGSVETDGRSERVVRPPATTLFHQLLRYLRDAPNPSPSADDWTIEKDGAAAAAVAIRWGSYAAVLFDSSKPAPKTRSPDTSRISDGEMARINIEASAALSEWLDILRTDPPQYEVLARRALAHLPLPKMRVHPQGSAFAMLALPATASELVAACDPGRVARARERAALHATRVFANALVNTAWRNGPVEDIHAGAAGSYRLDERRLLAAEERTLLSFACDRLAIGIDVCRALRDEAPPRPWSEQVVPYGLAEMLLITPSDWSLTESSREIVLPSR